jgi:hypothetical protein
MGKNDLLIQRERSSSSLRRKVRRMQARGYRLLNVEHKHGRIGGGYTAYFIRD